MGSRPPKNSKSKSLILSREGILLILLLFWLVIILPLVIGEWWAVWVRLSYIVTHIFILFFLTLLLWAVGRKISYALKLEYSHLAEEFPFATSLGLGFLSYLTLLLGALGFLHREAVYLLTGLLLILFLKEIRNILWDIKGAWQENKNFKAGPLELLIFSLLGLTGFIALTGTFTPPFSYDELAYHLGVPKTYIRNQQIIPLPFHVYSNFPFTVQMLYLYSILLTGGEVLAKMIHFLFAILTSFALYAIGRRYFNWQVGLLSAAIFINIPLVGQLSALCYTDLAVSAFALLTVSSFLNWYSFKDIPGKRYGLSWVVACGIFTGLAMGAKYTGITLLFFFVVLAIIIGSIINKRREKVKLACKNLALFVSVTVGVFSPWLIKNLLLTGNPFFPFLFPLFGGGNWSMEIYERFKNVHLPPAYSFQNFFSSFWELFTTPTIGLVFILILPMIFFVRGVDRQIKILFLYVGYFCIMWYFLTHHVDRFALPLFATLAIICAWIIYKIPKNVRILAGSLTGVVMTVNLFFFSLSAAQFHFLDVFLGIKTKDAFLLEKLYFYPAIKFINEELPPSSKILFIGDNQTYYCERPLLSNSPLDRNIIVEVMKKSPDARAIHQALRGMKITHIYLNASEVKRTQRTFSSFARNEGEFTRFKERFNEFIEGYTRKLFKHNGCFVWELK